MTDRYLAAVHAVQSGVKAEIATKGEAGAGADPKHLRVGVNMAMSDHGALVALLLEKGIITEAEYADKLAEFAEREKAGYEQRLTAHFGRPVSLA